MVNFTAISHIFRRKISRCYYYHGLLCAKYPKTVLFSTVVIVLLCSLPLLNRQTISANEEERRFATNIDWHQGDPEKLSQDRSKFPKWFTGEPALYIQSYILAIYYDDVKSKIWTKEEIDKKSLRHSFYLINNITNFKSLAGKKIEDFCFKSKAERTLFSSLNNCIIASPANLWKDLNRFDEENDVTAKIFREYDADLLIGVPLHTSGFQKPLVMRNYSQRTFAVNIVMKSFDYKFLKELRGALEKYYSRDFRYKLHIINDTHVQHVYYSEASGILELLPLLLTYVIVFLYIAFSVAKIEMVKSKWGLAFSAMCTVFAALTMPLGISTYLRLDRTLQNRDIYPYLVIIIGLENILVITKSVVSTPLDLEVRERIAEGLSKEGWSIWQNLISEITALLAGYFTNVPAIQEFCLFASVAILSEYFLQMFFFVPVLAIEVRRMELIDLNERNVTQGEDLFVDKEGDTDSQESDKPVEDTFGETELDHGFTEPSFTRQAKLPKRLAFAFSFWARTRIVQRALLVCAIGYLLYTISYIVFTPSTYDNRDVKSSIDTDSSKRIYGMNDPNDENGLFWKIGAKLQHSVSKIVTEEPIALSSDTLQLPWEAWYRLLYHNNYYLAGKHIGILPSIVLKYEYSSKPGRISKSWMNEVDQKNKSILSIDGIHLILPVIVLLTIIYYILSILISLLPTTRQVLLWFIHMCQPPQYHTTLVENVPTVLRGHGQDVECLESCGTTLVSSCLDGNIIAWNTVNSKQYCVMKRDLLTLPGVPKMRSVRFRHYDDSLLDTFVKESATNHMQSETSYKVSGMTASKSAVFSDLPKQSTLSLNKTHRRSRSDEVNAKAITESGLVPDKLRGDMTQQFENPVETSVLRRRGINTSARRNRKSIGNDELIANRSCLQSKDSDRGDFEGKAIELKLAIWCLICHENIVIVGCGNGNVEIWDFQTGYQMCCYAGYSTGVTCLSAIKNRLFVGRSCGTINILELAFYKPNGTYGRTAAELPILVKVLVVCTKKLHRNTVTAMKIAKDFVITASQDRTLKVWRLSDYGCTYTLHGHSGAVTCFQIDLSAGFFCVSGSQDSSLRVWDLSNGSCVHHLSEEHTTAILALKCDHKYAVSVSIDNVLCIWKYRAGVCIHRIVQSTNIISDVALLSNTLMITGSQGCLVVWNVRSGRILRTVPLEEYNWSQFVRHVHRIGSTTIACTYGSEIYLIDFSTIVEKKE